MDDLDQIKQLAGITQNVGRLQEYKGEGTVSTEGSNMSVTANEKIQYQKEHDITLAHQNGSNFGLAYPT